MGIFSDISLGKLVVIVVIVILACVMMAVITKMAEAVAAVVILHQVELQTKNAKGLCSNLAR